MNSIAFNREEGIIDYFGGAADIKAGVIRCVERPESKIQRRRTADNDPEQSGFHPSQVLI